MRGTLLAAALLWVGGCATDADKDGDGFSGDQDCDETNALVHVGADEACDGIDNDCDDGIDDADPEGPSGSGNLFLDGDSDGYGGTDLGHLCTAPTGAVLVGGDCDDSTESISPDAAEVCDGIDNNCDSLIDDADPLLDTTALGRFYADADSDGFGSAIAFADACAAPEGYVDDATDCDDSDLDRNPGAPEVCDGKDNNCDVATGLLVDDADPALDLSSAPTSYLDGDGDGYGTPDTTFVTCVPPSGAVSNDDDCNDADGDIRPGAPELCDGIDNNCDTVLDDGAWWDARWTYRRVFTVTGGTTEVEAPIVAFDLDADALLTGLGDASGLTPDAVRVVSQDCSSGNAEIPSEFIDAFTGLLESGDGTSPLGDGVGSVVFRYDEDGNLFTREKLSPGETHTFAVYFTSNADWATAPTPRPAVVGPTVTQAGPVVHPNTLTVDNGLVSVSLDRAAGGLVTSMHAPGKPNVGGQTSNVFGNGVYFAPAGGGPTGSWASAVLDSTGIITVQHKGSLVAIVDAEGRTYNDYGGIAYRYRTIVFQGRQEVYTKVFFQTTRGSHIGPQALTWSQAIRPWQIDNIAAIPSGGGAGTRDGFYRWAQGSYANNTYGLWLGWVTPPASLAVPTSEGTGRYLALAGQDFDATPTGSETNVINGTTLLNDHVIMTWPYIGTTVATKLTFLELLTPKAVSWGSVSVRTP